MHSPKHIAEYVVLRAVIGTLNLLPEKVAIGLGSGFANLVLRFSKATREEAGRRVRQVFGSQWSDDEVKRIVETAYRDLIWHTIEILRTPKLSPSWVERNAFMGDDDRRRLDEAVAKKKGAILAVPHLANWDLAGVGLQILGYEMTFIVRQQKNPLFDAYLNRMREHLGSEVLERDDPMLLRKVIRSLRRGNVVAILVDLRARHPDLELPFLGHTADLMRGVGVMAHLSGCPVLPAYATRLPDERHCWHIESPIHPDAELDRNEDAERIMREAIIPLEKAILEQPDQYFWFNKRWVLDRIEIPPGSASGN